MLGMAQHGVRVIAGAKTRADRSCAFWSAWGSQLCISVPVAVVYFVYLLCAPQGGLLVAAIWSLWVISASLDVSWLFFGCEDFRMPTERSFITKMASILGIFILVKNAEDLWLYVLCISLSYFANMLLLWPFVHRHVDWFRPKWSDIKRNFIPNLRLFAPVVAISLYTSLDKIMLGSISGMVQSGLFEYSEKLSKMPMSLITALGTVMLPRMTAALAAGRRADALQSLGKSMFVMEAAAMCLAFGIAAISPEFSIVFLGEGFEDCRFIMPVIAMTIPIISASNVIGVQYMLPTFSDRAYTLSVFSGAVVNVGLNLVLLKPFGALGAAVATVAAEAAVLFFQIWVVRDDLPLVSYARNALPFLLLGFFMYLVVRFYAMFLSPYWGVGWGLLLSEIVIGGIVFLFGSLPTARRLTQNKRDI